MTVDLRNWQDTSMVRSTLGGAAGHNSLCLVYNLDGGDPDIIRLDQQGNQQPKRNNKVRFDNRQSQQRHGEYVYSMVLMGDSNEDKAKLIQSLTGVSTTLIHIISNVGIPIAVRPI